MNITGNNFQDPSSLIPSKQTTDLICKLRINGKGVPWLIIL